MEKQQIPCKGCGEALNGQFCSHCGQKVIGERFTFRKIFDNLITAVFNIDRGILYTIKDLTIRPGTVANDYLNGKTKAYFNPFSFLIIAITATVLLTNLTGLYTTELEQLNEQNFAGKSEEYIETQKTIQHYIGRFLNLLIFTTLPGISILSYYTFRKKGLLLAEHFVVNCFFYGYIILAGILFIPIQLLFTSATFDFVLGLVIGTVYLTWVYKNWFGYPTLAAFLRAFVVYCLGYLMILVLFMILGVIIALILK